MRPACLFTMLSAPGLFRNYCIVCILLCRRRSCCGFFRREECGGRYLPGMVMKMAPMFLPKPAPCPVLIPCPDMYGLIREKPTFFLSCTIIISAPAMNTSVGWKFFCVG